MFLRLGQLRRKIKSLNLGPRARYSALLSASQLLRNILGLVSTVLIARHLGPEAYGTLAFALTLACYESHVVMDYFTVGRGVMALWPWTPERFSPWFVPEQS